MVKRFINLILLITTITFSHIAVAATIKAIKIKGNQRIEQSTIESYLGLSVGDQFSSAIRSEAVKKLYNTALFVDIKIKFNNGTLYVDVQENPFISNIEFKGNNKIKTDVLMKEIHSFSGESLSRSMLRHDVAKIREIYKRMGRYSTQVRSLVEPQENNRIKVVFEIDEGPKAGIKEISFAGNQYYTASELRSIIATKESRWWRFLETNDTFDPDRIEYDKYLLNSFYKSVGFADFRVVSVTADLLPTKEGFTLLYSLEEGEKYTFGKVELRNKLKRINEKKLLCFIDNNDNQEGERYNFNKIQEIAKNITDYLAGEGFPYVSVVPKVETNSSKKVANVIVVIEDAAKVFINNINIEGNLKTEDHVIRRQIKIAENDMFNRTKLEQADRNIRNLDYFGKFILTPSPTKKEDRYNIDIKVEEKSTAQLGFDVGYSNPGGPFGKISFLERNLLGTGRYLSAGVQMGKKSTSFYGGITDPDFMDKDFSLGLNLKKSRNGAGSGFHNGEQNYNLNSAEARLTAGYNITDDLNHSIDYEIKNDKLSSDSETQSIYIKEQVGTYTTSAISQTLTYDKLDSIVLPKNGYTVSGTQEFAGLGGNNKYLKHDVGFKAFKSFIDNKYTLKFSSSTGIIHGIQGKKVRISDRFNLGDSSLRGFAPSGIGPRDIQTKETLGGQKYYSLSTELNFPVGLPKEFNVTGALFVDAGALWDADSKALTSSEFYNSKEVRISAGFGFLWITKIAPIRVDWGFPLKKKSYDDTQTFHIKFTTSF